MNFVCHRKEQVDVLLQIDDRTTMNNLLLFELCPSCHVRSVFILLWSIARLVELIRSMLTRRSLCPDQMSTSNSNRSSIQRRVTQLFHDFSNEMKKKNFQRATSLLLLLIE